MKTRKLTAMALLSAIALTIFIIEAQIPPIVPIPGIKLGLANIITVYAVFAVGKRRRFCLYAFSSVRYLPAISAPYSTPWVAVRWRS